MRAALLVACEATYLPASERAARVRWLAFRWSERRVGAVGRVARVGCRCGVRRFRARCAAASPGKFLFLHTLVGIPTTCTRPYMLRFCEALHVLEAQNELS